MAISREQVLHVAQLAHLDLTDEEVDRFAEQLSAILEAVSKVSELDLADVPPTSHPLDLVNGFAFSGATTIPRLTGCGLTTPLLTLLMSGPGNAFAVRISPPS